MSARHWNTMRRIVRTFSSATPLVPLSPAALGPKPAALVPEMITPMLDRMDGFTTIVGYDKWGFTVSNIHMRGSVLVFPTFTLLWDVARAVDITPRSISPVHMVSPKPEYLIIGAGTDTATHVNPALYAYLSRRGISLEVMDIVGGIRFVCFGGAQPALVPRAPRPLLTRKTHAHRQHTTPAPPTCSPARYPHSIFLWVRGAELLLPWWQWSP
jgi:hypothetical protein